MYLGRPQVIGIKTEEEFARNSWNLTDEERISAFNENMNDGASSAVTPSGMGWSTRESGSLLDTNLELFLSTTHT
jgi:hypothetical protein